MQHVAQVLVVVVAALHAYFMVLEMFLWQKPAGLKAFGRSPEEARITATLAANQGLYNGFLAAGLVASFVFTSAGTALAFRMFFLVCVIVAGLYGAATASRKILFVQALPAALALAATLLAR